MLEKNSGFTLVELSIVMIIIGLLIGGILKGQQLITNARITSTIAQIKNTSTATLTFQDTYGGLPGDLASAAAKIPDCANAAYFCGDGDGDNIVGVLNSTGGSQSGVLTRPQIETTYFWKHLLLAGLIDGIQPTSNPTAPAWSKTHPYNDLSNGGFVVYTTNKNRDEGRGLSLRLQKYVTGGAAGNVITPLLAQQLDTKMDDGKPDYGAVQADFAGSNCDRGGIYNVEVKSETCLMYFQLY